MTLRYAASTTLLRPDVRDRLRQLQDLRSFRQAVCGGIVRPVRPDEVGGIDNTGDRWEASNWSPDKNRRVKQLYRSGGPVSMPIVLWNTVTGERHLLAGHHRLTYNSDVRGQPTNVLFLPYTS